jgi:integrase
MERKKIAPGLYRQETQSGPSFLVKFNFKGEPHSLQLKGPDGDPLRNEALAKTYWSSARRDIKKGIFPFDQAKRVDAALAEYLKFWGPPRNAESTHEDKTIRLNAWWKWTKARYPKVTYLTDLRREHFEEFQTRPVEPQTTNLYFRYLKHWLNWCVDRGWLTQSPIMKLKRLPEPNKPKKTLSGETIGKVFANLNPVARAAWAFCSDTGVRPGEMFRLRWEDVDFKNRSATYTQGKTGKVKTVYFSKETKKLIEAVPPKGDTLFYNSKGGAFRRLSWRDTVYHAASKAGIIKWARPKGKKGYVVIWGTPPNPYALRHTVTTDMLQEADIATVRDAMGHSNLAVTSIYAHSSQERIRAAFERLHKRKKV